MRNNNYTQKIGIGIKPMPSRYELDSLSTNLTDHITFFIFNKIIILTNQFYLSIYLTKNNIKCANNRYNIS